MHDAKRSDAQDLVAKIKAQNARSTAPRAKPQRKATAAMLQAMGMTRAEARRAVWGETWKQATSHPTRRTLLIEQSRAWRVRRRAKRRRAQAIASGALVAYLVES